jgi:hypothetical protein
MKNLIKKSKNNKKIQKKQLKKPLSIIGFWQLIKVTYDEISLFWRPLVGILVVYGVINFIFITSIALLPSSESLKLQIEELFGSDVNRFVSSITLVGLTVYDVASPSNTLLQMILFVIASMAFVWALRKLRGLKKFKVRQAYYEGTSNIIATMLVVVFLLLTLVPASIGAAIISFGLPIAGTGLEEFIVYLIGTFFILLSLYWLAVWWPSFYIVMLSGTTPINSMRAAAELTKKVRLRLFVRHLFILFSLILLFFCVAIPVSLIWQRLIPATVYVAIFMLFGIMHVMLFSLYRNLVDARQSQK